MSETVVVVGPTTVRGRGPVDTALAAGALECIDDDLMLVDDRVVPVDQVWRDVLEAALEGLRDDVILVCPSWWEDSRVARVEAAARVRSAVAVRRRVDVLATGTAVVEVAPELVVVLTGTQRQAVARVGASADVVGAVVACVDGLDAVTVDVPVGLEMFGNELAGALRRRDMVVTVVDDHAVVRAAGAQCSGSAVVESSAWRLGFTARTAVLTGAVVSAAILVAAAGLGVRSDVSTDAQEVTWLVEGRVAVEVPAQWAVERINSGPGSARVQVISPSDVSSAVQVTQSRVPVDQTLDAAAETLRVALAGEPAGVFVDFTAPGRRAERAVVSYREIRADHHVDWAVMLDRGVRIAIGCQSAPGHDEPEQWCDRAIRSAHAVA